MRVTEILKGAGLVDFSSVNETVLEAASNFGIAVHKATELWDKGTLDINSLSEPLIPYLEAWKKFRKDYNIDYKPEEIERKLYSKKWDFEGTPDRDPKEIKGEFVLPDIKSSTTMLPSVAIQTAAYQALYEENFDYKIKQRWGIQLLPDGTYKIHIYKNLSDNTIFFSALNVYRWKKENGLWKP